MSPLAGHTPIPLGWAEHHRPTAITVMTSTVRIERGDSDPSNDSAGWSPTAGIATAAPLLPVWVGPARIQAEPSSRVLSADAAGEDINHRNYLVQIPVDTPLILAAVDGGDVLTITACPGDPGAVGRVMVVVDVQYGSQSWTRDLLCQDTLPDNNPPRSPPGGGGS